MVRSKVNVHEFTTCLLLANRFVNHPYFLVDLAQIPKLTLGRLQVVVFIVVYTFTKKNCVEGL